MKEKLKQCPKCQYVCEIIWNFCPNCRESLIGVPAKEVVYLFVDERCKVCSEPELTLDAAVSRFTGLVTRGLNIVKVFEASINTEHPYTTIKTFVCKQHPFIASYVETKNYNYVIPPNK